MEINNFIDFRKALRENEDVLVFDGVEVKIESEKYDDIISFEITKINVKTPKTVSFDVDLSEMDNPEFYLSKLYYFIKDFVDGSLNESDKITSIYNKFLLVY